MAGAAPHVVFDCNVYFQALIGPSGPASACLAAAADKRLVLYLSAHVLEELVDVCSRPAIATKFGFTETRLQQYATVLRSIGVMIDQVPHVFDYQRDPNDAHYIDLAIATDSELVVSRDRDLLALRDPSDPAGQDFRARFPAIRIVTPAELLAEL